MGVKKRRGRPRKRRGKKTTISKSSSYLKKLNTHLHRRFSKDPITIRLNEVTNEFPRSLVFKLEDVQSYLELTEIYDQFRISSVQLNIMWSPSLLVDEGSVIIPPSLYTMWCVDRDDNNPLSIAELKERSRTKLVLMKPQVNYKVKVIPSILTQLYETLTSTGYGIKFGQKIDCNDANVPHYGFKFNAVKPPLANGSYDHDMGTITIDIVYNMTFYNTR